MALKLNEIEFKTFADQIVSLFDWPFETIPKNRAEWRAWNHVRLEVDLRDRFGGFYDHLADEQRDLLLAVLRREFPHPPLTVITCFGSVSSPPSSEWRSL